MAAKISEFIVGIILVGLITTIFGAYIAEMGLGYGKVYDNSSFDAYDSMNDMINISETMKEETKIDEKEGLLDIIGGYFSSGYSALRLTGASVDTFSKMSQQAIEDSNLGILANVVNKAITAIIMIIIFVGIFMAAIFKWEL